MMKLHFHPRQHWMNDPNGLCAYDGWYHMFFQYNPHGNEWGDIHWGHARSRDLYAWEELPIALTPDAARREQHCFSGSCCKDRAGKPVFYYTSIGYPEDGRTHEHGAQQWMAFPEDDALTTLRQTDAYAMKPDMHGEIVPEQWRDPCVIPYGDQWLMVLGGCVAHRGCVLLYTSQDMRYWTYHHILAQSDIADDVPWECPNLFLLDGKAVIFYSPCSAVCYQVGELDAALMFHPETKGELDPSGREGFYAPQVLRDDDGRCILMSWMPECDGGAVTERRGWNGCMALPRLMHVTDRDLQATLLDGWQAYCEPPVSMTVSQQAPLTAEPGQHYLLQTTLHCGEKLTLDVLATPGACETQEYTRIVCTVGKQETSISLERDHASSLPDCATTPMARTAPTMQGKTELLLSVDGDAVELCVNGRWISVRAYPQHHSAVLLRAAVEAERELPLTLYPMK